MSSVVIHPCTNLTTFGQHGAYEPGDNGRLKAEAIKAVEAIEHYQRSLCRRCKDCFIKDARDAPV